MARLCRSRASVRAAVVYIAIASAKMMQLRPFQRRFLAGALRREIDTAALSIPRGNGKSTLSAYILERCLTLRAALLEPGAEYLLGAASLELARNAYRPLMTPAQTMAEGSQPWRRRCRLPLR